MVHIKSKQDLKKMEEGGAILSSVLLHLLKQTVPGVSLRELDVLAEREILKRGAKPSFKTVKNYKWTICACVNDVVVHGIPGSYILRKGDVVGIDCGVYYKGFNTDSSWTIRLIDGTVKEPEADRFLDVGKKALQCAIKEVKIGNYIYDISKAMQGTIESAGFSTVRTLVGHGVGKKLHEEPEVPNFVSKPRLTTPKIVEGMTLAVEAIYNFGTADIRYKGTDGWTIATKDGKISGLFEATVVATSHGCVFLTKIDELLKAY